MALKKIGVPGWNVGDNTFGVNKSYLAFIERFGLPVILSPGWQHVADIDMLLLPGGADMVPGSYGAKASYWTGSPNMMLESFDRAVLPKYLESDIPILGICRGAQRLWVSFGGKMDQHNGWHAQSKVGDPGDPCHELVWFGEQEQENAKLLSKVNSRHHQTMNAGKAGDEGQFPMAPDDLEVLACAAAGQKSNRNLYYPSIVEVFRHRTKNILGVQFHPEDLAKDDFIPGWIENALGN